MANFYIGSEASFSATIIITYPSGSTVTISSYKKTWTAPSTNGSWIFKAKEVGVYTIKAINGTKSKSIEVFITTKGQSEKVTIKYELVLFDATDNTSITGGWVAKQYVTNYGSASLDNGIIKLVGSTASGGSASAYMVMYITKNKINLSDLMSLKAYINSTSGGKAAILVKSAQTMEGWWTEPLTNATCVTYKTLATSDANTDISVSLSSVTGSYYVGFLVGGDSTLVTPRVWGEY